MASLYPYKADGATRIKRPKECSLLLSSRAWELPSSDSEVRESDSCNHRVRVHWFAGPQNHVFLVLYPVLFTWKNKSTFVRGVSPPSDLRRFAGHRTSMACRQPPQAAGLREAEGPGVTSRQGPGESPSALAWATPAEKPARPPVSPPSRPVLAGGERRGGGQAAPGEGSWRPWRRLRRRTAGAPRRASQDFGGFGPPGAQRLALPGSIGMTGRAEVWKESRASRRGPFKSVGGEDKGENSSSWGVVGQEAEGRVCRGLEAEGEGEVGKGQMWDRKGVGRPVETGPQFCDRGDVEQQAPCERKQRESCGRNRLSKGELCGEARSPGPEGV
uniref:Uncharacterized protein n=1 Tax=Sphaerodactylus townsendi TaxID=933632 RepID=A0ACB8GE59_9SAUR